MKVSEMIKALNLIKDKEKEIVLIAGLEANRIEYQVLMVLDLGGYVIIDMDIH